jgi:hypothetical protein
LYIFWVLGVKYFLFFLPVLSWLYADIHSSLYLQCRQLWVIEFFFFFFEFWMVDILAKISSNLYILPWKLPSEARLFYQQQRSYAYHTILTRNAKITCCVLACLVLW